MHLVNLDETTRRYMRAEVEMDLGAGRTLYLGPRLSQRGRPDYPTLLLEAIDTGTPETLAAELNRSGRLNEWETSHSKYGRPYQKHVPRNAADMLAKGEFNRFYIRGLCARAVAEGIEHVQVYRSEDVRDPRPESQAKIGALMDPAVLLHDLRTHNDKESINTALGVPAGPNSTLSVQLVIPAV